MAQSLPKIGLGTSVCFGIAGGTVGALNLSIAFFALLYYNAALGVPASVVGAALALGLLADALSDPLVGAWSDRTRTRWGRRHPFLYAATLPTGLLFYLFWHPPDWALASDASAFWYLLAVVAGLRLSGTLFDVPSMALLPDLTTDYDERSHLMNYHANMHMLATAIISVLVFRYALVDPSGGQGTLYVEGYERAGTIGAIVFPLGMLIAAIGLHQHIPHLQSVQDRLPKNARFRPSEMFAPFRNRSLLALFGAMFCAESQRGVAYALFGFLITYFWGLTTEEFSNYNVFAMVGTPIAFLLMPFVFRNREKKHVAMAVIAFDMLILLGPIALRLLGLMPENGTPLLVWLLYTQSALVVVVGTFGAIAQTSMLAEIVEAHAVTSGDHLPGLISSTRSFTRKATGAIGTVGAGWILVLIDFPTQTDVADVPPETIANLGLLFSPVMLTLAIFAILSLAAYKISRRDHEANLEALGFRDTTTS